MGWVGCDEGLSVTHRPGRLYLSRAACLQVILSGLAMAAAILCACLVAQPAHAATPATSAPAAAATQPPAATKPPLPPTKPPAPTNPPSPPAIKPALTNTPVSAPTKAPAVAASAP